MVPVPGLPEDDLTGAPGRLVREERAEFPLEAGGLDLLHEPQLLEERQVPGKEGFADLEPRFGIPIDEEHRPSRPRQSGRRRAARRPRPQNDRVEDHFVESLGVRGRARDSTRSWSFGSVTRVRGGTEAVSQTLPPMTQPFPMTVSPPRIVAPA